MTHRGASIINGIKTAPGGVASITRRACPLPNQLNSAFKKSARCRSSAERNRHIVLEELLHFFEDVLRRVRRRARPWHSCARGQTQVLLHQPEGKLPFVRCRISVREHARDHRCLIDFPHGIDDEVRDPVFFGSGQIDQPVKSGAENIASSLGAPQLCIQRHSE